VIGIYKITSPTGKVYIGQSWKLEARKNKYKVGRCKGQVKVYNSLIKYGWEAHKFEVIHELPQEITQDILNTYETLYWQQYKNCGIELLNIKEPGSNGKPSDESRQKMRDSHLGVKKTSETKQRMSKAKKGVKMPPRSKEVAARIVETRKRNGNNKHTEEAKRRISEARKGRKHSAESIQKGIETRRRNGTLKHTEEAKQKMRKPKKVASLVI